VEPSVVLKRSLTRTISKRLGLKTRKVVSSYNVIPKSRSFFQAPVDLLLYGGEQIFTFRSLVWNDYSTMYYAKLGILPPRLRVICAFLIPHHKSQACFPVKTRAFVEWRLSFRGDPWSNQSGSWKYMSKQYEEWRVNTCETKARARQGFLLIQGFDCGVLSSEKFVHAIGIEKPTRCCALSGDESCLAKTLALRKGNERNVLWVSLTFNTQAALRKAFAKDKNKSLSWPISNIPTPRTKSSH
jgi:hypothetical protein